MSTQNVIEAKQRAQSTQTVALNSIKAYVPHEGTIAAVTADRESIERVHISGYVVFGLIVVRPLGRLYASLLDHAPRVTEPRK